MFLRNLWYLALPGRELRAGALRHVELLGEPVLLARGHDGRPFALRDICPHRGVPLSAGRFDGREVECPYHGWRFDGGGRCTAIPSLVPGQGFDVDRIRVRGYPCREVQGNVWVFMPDADAPAADPGEPPVLPAIGERAPGLVEIMMFPCHIDHAVIGLMDPAHGPFVHRSWWWRSGRSIHEKAKHFAPSPLGFTMVRHAPSSNSFAYRLLPGEVTTEIGFRLPGIRVETIRAGRHALVGLTAVTPVDERRTQIVHALYWTIPWLGALRPLVRPFARRFLGQDRDMVILQQQGLKHDPSLMLINDADVQAKWYFRLKREWERATEEGRPFENPLPERTLRWRS